MAVWREERREAGPGEEMMSFDRNRAKGAGLRTKFDGEKTFRWLK